MRSEPSFRRYLDFSAADGGTAADEERWVAAFTYFLKKVCLRERLRGDAATALGTGSVWWKGLWARRVRWALRRVARRVLGEGVWLLLGGRVSGGDTYPLPPPGTTLPPAPHATDPGPHPAHLTTGHATALLSPQSGLHAAAAAAAGQVPGAHGPPVAAARPLPPGHLRLPPQTPRRCVPPTHSLATISSLLCFRFVFVISHILHPPLPYYVILLIYLYLIS